ncbi:MAG: hypothetical protein CMI26_06295 [Opitutae bacterium]|nr:hypothetical protein [Opitutae bacterium]
MFKAFSWDRFDRAGMFVSFLCAVHCISLPFLLPFLPLLAGSFFWKEGFEETVVAVSLLIAGSTLFRGYLKHRRFWVLLAFGSGLTFLLLRPDAHGHGHDHAGAIDVAHYLFAACAGISLAFGHWLNLRFCKSCPVCSHNEIDNACSFRQ